LWPVELHVLAGAEMTESTIEVAGDVGKPTQLVAGKGTVWHCYPEHWRQPLNVQTIAQSQLEEFTLRQFTCKVTLGLCPIVFYAFTDESAVKIVVTIHAAGLILLSIAVHQAQSDRARAQISSCAQPVERLLGTMLRTGMR
jgi:hypothetical protein